MTIALFATPQVSRAELAELLGKLNLSTYPRVTWPPEFQGQTIEGRTASLASRRGKVVLVNFWATWCQECRPEMPMFEHLHREFAAQGLSVIGVNTREGTAAIRAYANELRLTFPLVLDQKGNIYAAYGVVGLPTTFLIGRDGRAVARAVGPREWNSAPARKLIQELLDEPK
ncbi:MAG TPA: TlpA disulfide reductase family protein, partial [Candidatus Eisenbacteria bacterium]|nr:TlpA disulfide reductase family protein [Candidatus Eisenbacteria bacterium]